MAQPTNLVDRYDADNSVREDLADVIYNIDPTDTPFMSNIGRSKADNTYFEWQTDSLAAANEDNAKIEGDDATLDSRDPTVRLGNYTQIATKVIGVSGTVQKVKQAGKKGELAYQMAKASAELKRDMEKRLCGLKAAVAGSATVARQTAGLGAFLVTNDSNGATAVEPTMSGSGGNGYPSVARTSGTDRAFTETLLKAVLQLVWNSGGNLDMLMVGAFNKTAASAFAGIAAQRHNATGNKPTTIIGAADIYVSDFGNVSIVANRFSPADTAYVVDPEYASVAYLRDFTREKLAKTGDSEKEMLLVEFGLKLNSEKAHGVVHDLTTS